MDAETRSGLPGVLDDHDTHSSASATCRICLFGRDGVLTDRAIPVLSLAARDFRGARRPEVKVWTFDALQRPVLSDDACADAECADVVAVVLDGSAALGEPLEAWLELWQRQRAAIQSRLLAVCHPTSSEYLPLVPAFSQLARFAIRSGVGLIWCAVADDPPVCAGPAGDGKAG